jgi:hypothetical protein
LTTEEAVKACEFWTTTASVALGTTRDPKIGAFFEGDEFPWEWSKPNGPKGWAIRIPAKVRDGPFTIDNIAFKMVEQEIERRRAS